MTVMSGRNISFRVLFARLADVVFADAKYRLVSEGVLVREAPARKRYYSNGICQIPFHSPPLKQMDVLWQLCLSNFSQFKHLQGGFFYRPAQISVLKRKTLFNQRGPFVHREFNGTESLIGCPSFFILVLKIGSNI